MDQFLISLITPTRERVEKCVRYLSSVVSTAKKPHRIEALFYVDDDDPQVDEYKQCLLEVGSSLARVEIVVCPFSGVSHSWNELAKTSHGDAICMGNDDLVYLNHDGHPAWDDRLESEARNWKDKHGHDIWCMWFADGIGNSANWPTFPMISREYYRTVGYFAPEPKLWGADRNFGFFFNDTWVGDVSKKAGCQNRIGNPQYLQHWHHNKHPSEADGTTHRAREFAKQSNDPKLFEETARIRDSHANKLRTAMG